MVIAFRDFRDEEYLVPKQVLEENNIGVDTASTQMGVARGKLGHFTGVDLTLDDLQVEKYDAVIFVGGPGTPTVRASPLSGGIAMQFARAGKVVAAICWAPTILAKAGVLRGKRATVWVGNDPEYGTTTDKVLGQFGAVYSKEDVTIDGKIVTADGPESARKFGETIAKLLK